MVYAALSSGGKDSILACQKALDAGLEVRYMVTVRPADPDSYMFHSANLDAVRAIADAAGMEYVEIQSGGEKEAELAELEAGLAALEVEGIVTGAVGSVYQRDRLAAIADRLGLALVAPLWGMDPEALLREVAARLDAIIVVTAADGLDESFLGAHFDDALIERLKTGRGRPADPPRGRGRRVRVARPRRPVLPPPRDVRVGRGPRQPRAERARPAGLCLMDDPADVKLASLSRFVFAAPSWRRSMVIAILLGFFVDIGSYSLGAGRSGSSGPSRSPCPRSSRSS